MVCHVTLLCTACAVTTGQLRHNQFRCLIAFPDCAAALTDRFGFDSKFEPEAVVKQWCAVLRPRIDQL